MKKLTMLLSIILLSGALLAVIPTNQSVEAATTSHTMTSKQATSLEKKISAKIHVLESSTIRLTAAQKDVNTAKAKLASLAQQSATTENKAKIAAQQKVVANKEKVVKNIQTQIYGLQIEITNLADELATLTSDTPNDGNNHDKHDNSTAQENLVTTPDSNANGQNQDQNGNKIGTILPAKDLDNVTRFNQNELESLTSINLSINTINQMVEKLTDPAVWTTAGYSETDAAKIANRITELKLPATSLVTVMIKSNGRAGLTILELNGQIEIGLAYANT